MKFFNNAGICALTLLSFSISSYATSNLKNIILPEGFFISMYTDKVKGIRSLSLGDKGFVFAGTRTGKVYAIVDKDGDKKAEKVYTVAEDLNIPNGIAFLDSDLYIAENHRIIKYKNIIPNLMQGKTPTAKVIYKNLPTEMYHGWRYMAVGPDKKLYFSIGAPCNVCKKDNPIFAAIHRINLNGFGLETVAHGVRNSVGFDWQPKTGKLWFTDNGRDWLGDDLPPDEINRLDTIGEHFGFPHCHSKLRDDKYGSNYDCKKDFKRPVHDLQAHVASLGMRFYTGSLFPKKYRGQIFIAEHGSWNRSSRVGYRITNIFLKEDGSTEYKTFAHGFLEPKKEKILGRPVDLLNMPDGSLLVSDDRAGAIYRISWKSGS